MRPNNAVIARSEATKQSSSFRVRGSGLLRFARNDGSTSARSSFIALHSRRWAQVASPYLNRLSVSCGFNLQEYLHQFQTLGNYGRTGRAARDPRSVMTLGGKPPRLSFMSRSEILRRQVDDHFRLIIAPLSVV